MRKVAVLPALFLCAAILFSCGGKFDGTVWECKYDYKEFQDQITGHNILEFLPGSKMKGTFTNFGPLPPSVLMYDCTVKGDVITCLHSDVDPRVFNIKDDKLVSEDGHCIYVRKEATTAAGNTRKMRRSVSILLIFLAVYPSGVRGFPRRI